MMQMFLIHSLQVSRLAARMCGKAHIEIVFHQPLRQFGQLDKCTKYKHVGDKCWTVRISYFNETQENFPIFSADVERFLPHFKAASNLNDDDIAVFRQPKEEMAEDLRLHSNQTTVAVSISRLSLQPIRFHYVIHFNSSFTLLDYLAPNRKPDGRNELQMALDRAFIAYVKEYHTLSTIREQDIELRFKWRLFPQLGIEGFEDAIHGNGPVFYYCGIMFQFVILLFNICAEKDLKLREGLKMIGLKDSAYWCSWFITGLCIGTLATLVLMASGHAFRFNYFIHTQFSVNFVLFFLYSITLVLFAFFVSTFISKSKSSCK